MVATMTQALSLEGGEKVLEIGTGSGYQTAVLAEIAERVFSIERIAPLYRRARALLDHLGYHRVVLRHGDGTLGWREHAPYDAIVVTAGARTSRGTARSTGARRPPRHPGGRAHPQTLLRITRGEDGDRRETLGGCVFVSLIGSDGWRAAEKGPSAASPSPSVTAAYCSYASFLRARAPCTWTLLSDLPVT